MGNGGLLSSSMASLAKWLQLHIISVRTQVRRDWYRESTMTANSTTGAMRVMPTQAKVSWICVVAPRVKPTAFEAEGRAEGGAAGAWTVVVRVAISARAGVGHRAQGGGHRWGLAGSN